MTAHLRGKPLLLLSAPGRLLPLPTCEHVCEDASQEVYLRRNDVNDEILSITLSEILFMLLSVSHY